MDKYNLSYEELFKAEKNEGVVTEFGAGVVLLLRDDLAHQESLE